MVMVLSHPIFMACLFLFGFGLLMGPCVGLTLHSFPSRYPAKVSVGLGLVLDAAINALMMCYFLL